MVHYLTEEMIADCSTKPTQGSLFICQSNMILGLMKEDFGFCGSWHKEVLMKYDLFGTEEKDLESMQ